MKRILCLLCFLSVVGIGAQTKQQTNNQAKHQSNNQETKKIGIKDIFLMLPDSAFDHQDFTLENRKKMLKTIGKQPEMKDDNNENTYSYIEVCDPRNGYLSAFYYFLEGYKYEICYWNLKDGRKLVGVNKDEGHGELQFYLYENGKLKKDSSYEPQTYDIQVSDFFETSHLNSKEKKILQDLFKNRIVFQYVLPRKGTSIEMRVGSIPFDMDYESMFDEAGLKDEKVVYKHIIFKWVNEKWVKEVRKGFKTAE